MTSLYLQWHIEEDLQHDLRVVEKEGTLVGLRKSRGHQQQLLVCSILSILPIVANSFALPKLLGHLHVSFFFLAIVSAITSINFIENDTAWTQATLTVNLGGRGIRRAEDFASCAYLAYGLC